MPILWMLCGPVCSGKSSYRRDKWPNDDVNPHYQLVDTDSIIEKWATEENKTYNDIFKDQINNATVLMYSMARRAIARNRDVVFDQTNLTRKSRRSKLEIFTEAGYYTVGVFFFLPEGKEKLLELVKARNVRPGKIIPTHVVESMVRQYEYPVPPEVAEEFDETMWVNASTMELIR